MHQRKDTMAIGIEKVAVQLHFIDADSAVLCAGLGVLIHNEAVNLGSAQAVQPDLTGDFIVGVAGHNVQIFPVAAVAQGGALAAFVHSQIIFLRQDLGIQNLEAVSGGDEGRALLSGVERIPLTQNHRLLQLKANPSAVAAGAPLGATVAVKEIHALLAGVLATGNDILYSQLVFPVDLAQGGTFYGDDVAAAVGIGDFHLDPRGRSDLPGQISLVHPVGIHQRGGQGATLHQASGGIPVAQQIQHLISGAIILHHRRGDVIPLHGRLLAVVDKALGSKAIAINCDFHVAVYFIHIRNSYVFCAYAFRHQKVICFRCAAHVSNLGVALSIQ